MAEIGAPLPRAKNDTQNEYQLGFEMAKKWVCEDGFFLDGDGDGIEMMNIGLREGSREAELKERENKEIIKTMLWY